MIFIDDDDDLRAAQTQGLELAGFMVQAFSNGLDALKVISSDFPGVIITDVRMPGIDGMEVFARIQAIDVELPVIFMTGHGDVPMAVTALKGGAYDFITKPFSMDTLSAALRRALETRRLVIENRQLRSLYDDTHDGSPRLLGNSPIMDYLRRTISQVADAEVDILVEGDTGVGKELVARTIHRQSLRKNRPFVHVNCAAMPDAVFAAELFGVESGTRLEAQAPLSRRTTGRIEKAQKGTLYLDDIEGLSLPHQSQLLSVVEARELWVLGAEDARPIDIRIVASSRINLGQAVQEGTFRADLYYRLSGVTLKVPPLRERRDDIPLLFQHFLVDACLRLKRPMPLLSADAATFLQRHDWPGNVRELEQYAERFALGLNMIPKAATGDGDRESHTSLADRVGDFEATAIRETLSACHGNAQDAMHALKLPRKTFYDKLSRHKIDISSFRLKVSP
ncbi:C4-dicarboxylate transport transcriptional regulatory protein DctD [Asticcacaulis endophyticus]|uniref:C4-dicarboxylate transport transcriptional regulatory protein DctD n=1 Tax=Asticcacaulis endophyticus TaxID=1395890 RepID=A0A918Q726_9CAUL|nr:C4-dicarboxylate transport transcriptional regulatory protein DctD [Asticcacaulis endophyticus]